MVRLINILMFFFATAMLHASVVTWDGDGGDKDWFNPINWDGDFVPAANDDVIIPIFAIASLGDDASIQTLTVRGTFTIEDSAVLGVFVGASEGVFVDGGVLNVEGKLNILLSGIVGLRADSDSQLNVSGAITISQAQVGIRTTHSNSAFLEPPIVSILPEGSVSINQVSTGISNAGEFSNQGSITISQPILPPGGVTHGMLLSTGSFTNRSLGVMNIDDGFMRGISQSSGVLDNIGTIVITGVTQWGVDADNITNSGSLSIVRPSSNSATGIIASSGIIENQETGEIQIGILDDPKSFLRGVSIAGGTFVNEGGLGLSSFIDRGIIIQNLGSLTNSNKINITVLDLTGIGIELSNSASMTNTLDGELLLEVQDQILGDLIKIELGSSFEDLGLFDIRMN